MPPSPKPTNGCRANPKQAAQVATRWIPGLKHGVAGAAMEFNIQRPATGDFREQFPRALVCAGSPEPARRHQIDI